YGLLWMVTLAGSPTLMPSMLSGSELNAANALEMLSFSVSGVIGLPLAGFLLSVMNGADVVAFDRASYFFLVACFVAIGPLAARTGGDSADAGRGGIGPALRFAAGDRFVRHSTIMYMFLNVGRGILDVLLPVILLRNAAAGSRILGLVTGGAALG